MNQIQINWIQINQLTDLNLGNLFINLSMIEIGIEYNSKIELIGYKLIGVFVNSTFIGFQIWIWFNLNSNEMNWNESMNGY